MYIYKIPISWSRMYWQVERNGDTRWIGRCPRQPAQWYLWPCPRWFIRYKMADSGYTPPPPLLTSTYSKQKLLCTWTEEMLHRHRCACAFNRRNLWGGMDKIPRRRDKIANVISFAIPFDTEGEGEKKSSSFRRYSPDQKCIDSRMYIIFRFDSQFSRRYIVSWFEGRRRRGIFR